jgi:hypothetical protein
LVGVLGVYRVGDAVHVLLLVGLLLLLGFLRAREAAITTAGRAGQSSGKAEREASSVPGRRVR